MYLVSFFSYLLGFLIIVIIAIIVTIIVDIRPLAVAGTVLWIRACPSVHPFVRPSIPCIFLSGSFLGIGSLVFSETFYVIRDGDGDVHDIAHFFWEKPPCNKIDQNWLKMAP